MVARTVVAPAGAGLARSTACWMAWTATRAARPDTPVTSAAAKPSATVARTASRESGTTSVRVDRSGNLGRLVEHSRSDRPCGPLGMSQQLFGRDHDVAARRDARLRWLGRPPPGPSAAERGSTRMLRGQPVAPRQSRRRREPICLSFSRRTSSTAARGSATAIIRRISAIRNRRSTAARSRTKSVVRSGDSGGGTGHLQLTRCADRSRSHCSTPSRTIASSQNHRASVESAGATRRGSPGLAACSTRTAPSRPDAASRARRSRPHLSRAVSAAWTTAAAKRLSSEAATSRSSSLPDAAARTRGEPSRFRPTIVQGPGTAA